MTPHDHPDDAHMIKQMVDRDEDLQAALELAASRIEQFELHTEMAVGELLDVHAQLKLLQASHAAVQKHDGVIRALYKGMEGDGPAGHTHNPFKAQLLQLELITLQQHLINTQEEMQHCVRDQLSRHASGLLQGAPRAWQAHCAALPHTGSPPHPAEADSIS